jgi:hypothetical protein
MKATVADLFDAFRRVAIEFANLPPRISDSVEVSADIRRLQRVINTISDAMEGCHCEVEVPLDKYREMEQFFSKTNTTVQGG